MGNQYRTWDKKAGFEEAMPESNHYRCDTGFGPGKLTCYARACKTNVGALSCTTRSVRFTGSGVKEAHLPVGYTMTGGGLLNHYRTWNKKAGFEESRPNGNSWRGDMGFGWGDYTVYVRGCKAPKGHTLNCVTRHVKGVNYNKVKCPSGYVVTGCGVNNHHRKWDAKSGFEAVNPASNTQCDCDTAFGSGDNTCYARCCKLGSAAAEKDEKVKAKKEKAQKDETAKKVRERASKEVKTKRVNADKAEREKKRVAKLQAEAKEAKKRSTTRSSRRPTRPTRPRSRRYRRTRAPSPPMSTPTTRGVSRPGSRCAARAAPTCDSSSTRSVGGGVAMPPPRSSSALGAGWCSYGMRTGTSLVRGIMSTFGLV